MAVTTPKTPFSLYDASILQAKGALMALEKILAKSKPHPKSASFPSARLYEDMKPLTFQVHIATSYAEAMAAQLSGREAADFDEDQLETFADMHERIDQVLRVLNLTDKDIVNQRGEVTEPTVFGPNRIIEAPFKAHAVAYRIPNILFHVSIAYAILRKEGVPLSKRDFSRSFVADYIEP